MRVPSPVARRLRHAVALLSVVAVLLPATALAAPDPRSRQSEIQRELERAREGLEEVERQRVVTVEDLEVIEAERARLEGVLAGLRDELSDAESALGAAEARVAATTARLAEAEAELGATRERLVARQQAFSARARAAYMGASAAPVAMLLDARDVAEVGRRLAYVETVLRNDQDQIADVGSLARLITAETRRLDAIRREQDAARAVAQGERDRIAAIVAEQEQVRGRVAAEQERHRLTLIQLESDKTSYTRLVASLEDEGKRLEEELRRRTEEQRRRAAGRRATAVAQAPAGNGLLQRPTAGAITSGYGWRTHPIFGGRRFHAGVDFNGGFGAAIFAAEAGVVVSAGPRGGYGNAVVVDHGGGLATLYAHQQRMHVSAGQRVVRGQQIGEIGSTGYSTGPHLHFEVRVNGQTRDPRGYL